MTEEKKLTPVQKKTAKKAVDFAGPDHSPDARVSDGPAAPAVKVPEAKKEKAVSAKDSARFDEKKAKDSRIR